MLYFRSPAADSDTDLGLGLPEARDGRSTSPLSTFSTTGFAPSVVIDTARGSVLARDLEPGDKIITRDHGLVPVRWVGESMEVYDGDAAEDGSPRGPVRVKAGALGTDPDAGNVVLNAGHRVLVRNPLNELYFGTDEVIAAIGDLTHLDGVDVVPRSVMRFRHVLLDTHELVRANGIWVESFAPDMWAMRIGFPEQWADITECLPRLRYETGEANYITPRMTLDAREARMMDAA